MSTQNYSRSFRSSLRREQMSPKLQAIYDALFADDESEDGGKPKEAREGVEYAKRLAARRYRGYAS